MLLKFLSITVSHLSKLVLKIGRVRCYIYLHNETLLLSSSLKISKSTKIVLASFWLISLISYFCLILLFPFWTVILIIHNFRKLRS
jgi:hypothetical protein